VEMEEEEEERVVLNYCARLRFNVFLVNEDE